MLSIRAHCPIQIKQLILWRLLYLISCFHLLWKKYIVCDVFGPRSPSFESSSVLYIPPTDTYSMQNLILQGSQQKLQNSCSRCNKNTWHVESSYILQPPIYLLLFVNRFRYINNNVAKDRCSIPMDTTFRLGPLKFSLRATIDHHGPSIHSGHYNASINCCKNILRLELLTAKTPLLHMLYYMNWLIHYFWTRTGGWEGALAHPLHPIDNRSRNRRRTPVGWMMCFLPMTFVPRPEALYIYMYVCMFIYIYIYTFFYMSSVFFGLPIVSCSLMIIV